MIYKIYDKIYSAILRITRKKSFDLCDICKYSVVQCNYGCSGCPRHKGAICECSSVPYGKRCPYFKEAKDG